MKASPVHYYYKCPTTGVEMNFSKRVEFGWGVSFPKGIKEYQKLLEADIKVPWPALSAEEQAVVDENYKQLHEMMGRDEDETITVDN